MSFKIGKDVSKLNGQYFDYDFGGEPDLLVDVVRELDHLAAAAIVSEFRESKK